MMLGELIKQEFNFEVVASQLCAKTLIVLLSNQRLNSE